MASRPTLHAIASRVDLAASRIHRLTPHATRPHDLPADSRRPSPRHSTRARRNLPGRGDVDHQGKRPPSTTRCATRPTRGHRGREAPSVPLGGGRRLHAHRHLARAAHHGRVHRGVRHARRRRPGGDDLRLGARRAGRPALSRRRRRRPSGWRAANSRSSPAPGRASWRRAIAARNAAAAGRSAATSSCRSSSGRIPTSIR